MTSSEQHNRIANLAECPSAAHLKPHAERSRMLCGWPSASTVSKEPPCVGSRLPVASLWDASSTTS